MNENALLIKTLEDNLLLVSRDKYDLIKRFSFNLKENDNLN